MRLLVLIILSLLTFVPRVFAKPKPVLHWGYVHFPPYYFETASGKADGELVQLLQREVRTVQYPDRRMVSLLNEGELNWVMVMSSVLPEKQLCHNGTSHLLAAWYNAGA